MACNSISMRGKPRPSGAEVTAYPNLATGPQEVAAGINGEIWEPHPDRSLRRNLGSASEDVVEPS